MLAWLAARGVDRALGSSLLEKGDFPDVEALRAADAGALAALGISDEPGRAKLLQAIRSDELLKKKKKRKPRSKKNKGGADKSAQQLAEQLSNLQRRASEVDQLYSVAQACLQKHQLDEALEKHHDVIRAVDMVCEDFKPSAEGTEKPAANGSTPTSPEEQMDELLRTVRATRARAMAEAVNLLAHADRYDRVPVLCSRLLEQSENEQEEQRWLFHRGRAYVKQWEHLQHRGEHKKEGNKNCLHRALEDFNTVIKMNSENHEALQWRAWSRWLMGHHENCVTDCDRGLALHSRNIPLLRLRGDALVELSLFRRALQDFDTIVHLLTDGSPEQETRPQGNARELQELLRRKHAVANQFLLQADDLTAGLLTQIDGREGEASDSSTSQEDQMGLFHGMLLREGQFTGVIHVGNGITSCKLEDEHKEMLDSALTCMANHQFKEALAKVKALRDLGNEMLRGPLMCFDAELKMNAVQLAIHVEASVPLDQLSPILDYAICIFRESAEAHYHRQALWILATVYIKRGRLQTAVRVLDELIQMHPQYRHSYCQKVELLKADGCSVDQVAEVVQKLEKLQDEPEEDGESKDSDAEPEPASEPEPQPMIEEDNGDDEDSPNSAKSKMEAQVLLENAKRSLASMRKDAASGVTQRVREAIQSRIQLIQSEEVSRPVLVSLAAAVAYTHAQRFKLAQDMIGKTIKQNPNVAEIFVVRAHVRYTEGSSSDGETASRCWHAAVEDCNHALRLNSECWPALWWKAQALSHLSAPRGSHRYAREALASMRQLLEFQPSFQQAVEFQADFSALDRRVMLADASQCINVHEYEKSLAITTRLLEASPQNPDALRWRATALGEMIKRPEAKIEPIFRDAMFTEAQIIEHTLEQSKDHIDALARRTETTLEYMQRAGVEIKQGNQRVRVMFVDLNKALELEPRHRASLLLRARVNQMIGKLAESIEDCTRMLESDRKSDGASFKQRLDALGMRARSLMLQQRFREAMVDFDRAIKDCAAEGLRDAEDAVDISERTEAFTAQKAEANRALQAEVKAAEDSLLEELEQDGLAADRAQAKREKKQRQKAKKQRQNERAREPQPEPEPARAPSPAPSPEPSPVEDGGDSPGTGGTDGADNGQGGASARGNGSKKRKPRRKGEGNGTANGTPNGTVAENDGAGAAAAQSVSPAQMEAAQEQLAALFGDLPPAEREAALAKAGYNVEAACNDILGSLDGEEPAGDTLAAGTLLEVVDEWEEVQTRNARQKGAVDRCIDFFGSKGLTLRRSELDEPCWERLTEVSEATLTEAARQYLHRQRAASRRQGQGVLNKSALMMSIVHKLSQRSSSSGGSPKSPKSPKSPTKGRKSSSPPKSPTNDGSQKQATSPSRPRPADPPASDPPAAEPAQESQPVEPSAMDTAETAKAVVEKAFLSAGAAEISGEAVQATGSEDVDAAVEERQEEAEDEEELSFGDVPPEPSEGEGSILFGAADDEGGILFGAPDEAPAAAAEPQPEAAAVEEEEEIVDEGPFEQHCRRLRQPGYPAGELELHALAAMLQCALSFSHRSVLGPNQPL